MAVEKFIHGKKDSCHHDGLYSIRKREQEADYELADWKAMEAGELYDPIRPTIRGIKGRRNIIAPRIREQSPLPQVQLPNNVGK